MNFRRLLIPFSWLYILITDIRNRLFDKGVLKGVQFDLPVIAIGNLRVGGEGKTPHIEYLIRLLHPQFKTAVLSRGYGRKTTGYREVTTQSTASECGDEPVQFKRKFEEVTVVVDEQRALGIAHLLVDAEDTQVVLLDDAYQHRWVKAGKYILLTAYEHLYTRDAVLPAGNLREKASGAQRADVIIVTKCTPELTEQERSAITHELAPLPHQQVFFTCIQYVQPTALFQTRAFPNHVTSVLLLTGIANPQPLVEYVKHHWGEVKHLAFPDHHTFTENNIQQVIKQWETMPEGTVLLTTEKDAVRLLPFTQLHHLPVFYLPITIGFIDDENEFHKLIYDYVDANTRNR
jgi:tetraacyldisaccharide 4'-kinase